MKKITGQYTLFIHIPVCIDGPNVLTDPLWAKDLALHLEYIEDFKLCCPVETASQTPAHYVRVKGLTSEDVIGLQRDFGYRSVLRNIVPNFLSVARAARKTSIAHSGGAGWAFPLAFYLLPLSFLMRFEWIMVIESSFWMKPENRTPTLRETLRHAVYKSLLGRCLRRAKARIFTTDGYRQFFSIPEENSLINPAIWIDADQMISDTEQKIRLAGLSGPETRLLFPARLVPDKGCDTILQAIERCDAELINCDTALHIDIIGDGPLRPEIEAFVTGHTGPVSVRLLDTVEYGKAFFTLLRDYHAVLLANKQHEQPRVVFDAFSQGVPVISSDTMGVTEISVHEQTALHYPVNNSAALAEQILTFAHDPALRDRLAQAALLTARGRSHDAMHQTRLAFLHQTLSGQGVSI